MLFISIAGVLSPIAPLIYVMTTVIIADFIFAIYKAYRVGETINSRKMSQILPKILLYNIVITTLFISDKYVLNTGIGVEKIACSLIILVELVSLDESFTKIFGYSLWNKVVKAIDRGKSTTK